MIEGVLYVVLGAVAFVMGVCLIGASGEMMTYKWYFGVGSIVFGLISIYLFIILVCHATRLILGVVS
ncbi:MAG: hypothetical protein ACRDQZ_09170 [Mycobacteriales bacterium]